MKQIKIGICDDEKFYLEELYNLVYTCGRECRFDLAIDVQLSAKELLRQITAKEKEYDMLFLDVEMPEMTGVQVAKSLRKNGYEGIICFVTSYGTYALEAFDVEAMKYLIKPAQYEDVKRFMKKAVVQLTYRFSEEEGKKRYVEIHTQKEDMRVDMEQILYVEKRRNQCVFHMEDGELVCYQTLKSVYSKLNQTKFCYAHQGFIVNFDKVKEVMPEIVSFGAGREAPVSRKFYKVLKERKYREIQQLKESMGLAGKL